MTDRSVGHALQADGRDQAGPVEDIHRTARNVVALVSGCDEHVVSPTCARPASPERWAVATCSAARTPRSPAQAAARRVGADGGSNGSGEPLLPVLRAAHPGVEIARCLEHV